MQWTILYSQITIDVSPPVAGVVHDGIPESNDIDFQDDLNLHIFWDGFFDKESGVKFYKYAFDSECREGITSENVCIGFSIPSFWIVTYYIPKQLWSFQPFIGSDN